MVVYRIRILFCLLSLSPVNLGAQEVIPFYDHRDEYTVREHFTKYISNLVGQIEFKKEWSEEDQTFRSYLPTGLTFEPFAGKVIDVETSLLGIERYKLQKPEELTSHILDSIFKKGKTVENTEIRYDSLGRLVKMYRIDTEYRTKEKQEVNIRYLDTNNQHHIYIDQNRNSFTFFANYRSKYAGNIIGRPLRLRSSWSLHYVLDEKGIMREAENEYESFANRKVNTIPGSKHYEFLWDERGRLLERREWSKGDSVPVIVAHEVYENPFDYSEAEKEYEILKVPQIKRWIQLNFEPESLTLVDAEAYKRTGTYLMYDHSRPVLFMHASKYPVHFIYDIIEDSLRTDRAKYTLYKVPDVNDSSVYDPNYRSHVTEVVYTQCSIETNYSRPPGLLDSESVDAFRREVVPMMDGWKMIKYSRGSDTYTRFALGYPARVRHDVIHDKLLFLDTENVVRYYYDNKKFYKLTEED